MKRALVLTIALLLSGVTSTPAREERLSDERIQHLVEDALDRLKIRPADLEVAVSGAEVALTGTVANAWERERAVEAVMEIADVQALDNGLVVARAESDAALAEEISEKLRNYTFFTIFDDATIGVQDGQVVLRGRVTMPFKAQALGEMAARVKGVQGVTNEIQVLPTSIGDDRIREDLAMRLYRDSLFFEYSFRANPPIHIVVERGRVTLTGVVRSPVEKAKAEAIARSTPGVFRVESRLELSR